MAIKYAKCSFNRDFGVADVSDLMWLEGTVEEACNHVKEDSGTCVLFFPKDVEGRGDPLLPEASRDLFEAEPALVGVCYYKGHSGYVFF